tara:strand:+ start:976 stop:2160 length:1185 start_codon:yes stop_codon:yes gene_type:complete
MGGGLMQLVAYGAQDVYLTGNPQITFFKVVYRRHTNFSMESIRQVWMGGSELSGHMSCTISRNGDLVNGLHLQLDMGIATETANPGYTIIDTVECEIGGQMIDRQSGEWMEVYSELTEPSQRLDTVASKTDGTNVGLNKFQMMSGCGGVSWAADIDKARWIVPLRFWFCRNPGLALPLIALQYHEVKINLSFIDDLTNSPPVANKLYADYIYLDTDERRRFAQVSHEYLIEQVQRREYTGVLTTMDLDFNHPVKELVWCAKRTVGSGLAPDLPGFTDMTDVFKEETYQIKLNGHDRFSERPLEYFTRYQLWRHHSGSQLGFSALGTTYGENVAVYSFALKPEEHQPSGTCNFSRIDNAQLLINGNTTSSEINVYAINYNVLRIMSGMGGLAYSN